MKLKTLKHCGLTALAGAALMAVSTAVPAKELPEGTVISAANLDAIADDTFEGHKIRDLLTGPLEEQIRKYGLQMPLEHSTEVRFGNEWEQATKANAGKASIGADGSIQGYAGAGVPFPMDQIRVDDPQCGQKLVWNYYYGAPTITNSWAATGEVFILDAKAGVVNNFVAQNVVMKWDGRYGDTPTLQGLPNEHARFVLVLTAPYDIAGIGVLNRQYSDAKDDEGYVYVRAMRRTRRTPGGKSWIDPQPKMTLLNDDSEGLQANPMWYSNWKCVAERYVLEVVDMPDLNYANKLHDISKWVDVKNPPHWNYINTKYQPRKVFVVEGTPPDYHPYGKKVLYMEATAPFFYHGEFYDKKDTLWRIWHTRYAPYWNGDCKGQPNIGNFNTLSIDLKAQRTTYINQTINAHDCFEPSFLEPSILQRAATGEMQAQMDSVHKDYLKRPALPQYQAAKDAWLQANPAR